MIWGYDDMKQKDAMTDDQKMEMFAEILRSAENVVFLGGAGVSTESGIPDFRSKNGLYILSTVTGMVIPPYSPERQSDI